MTETTQEAKETSFVGYSAFFEFKNPDVTKSKSLIHVIVTPDAFSKEGRPVPSMVYHRHRNPKGSVAGSRTAWRHYSLKTPELDSVTGRFKFPDEGLQSFATDRATLMAKLIKQISALGYRLTSKPIIVQTSVEDLEEFRKGATPYKLISRINRSRRILGFSE